MTLDELTDEQRERLGDVARLTAEASKHYQARRFPEAAPLYQEALAFARWVQRALWAMFWVIAAGVAVFIGIPLYEVVIDLGTA